MLPQLTSKQVLVDRHNFLDGYRQRRRADLLGQESDVFEMIAINEQELEIERQRLEQESNYSRVSFQKRYSLFSEQFLRELFIKMINQPLNLDFISLNPLRMTVLKHITNVIQIQKFKSLVFLLVNTKQCFILKMTLFNQNQFLIHSIRECQVMTLIKEEYPLLIQEGQDLFLNQTGEIRFDTMRSFFFFGTQVLEGTLFLLYSDELDMQTKQDMISQAMSLVFRGNGTHHFAQLELATMNLVVTCPFSFDLSQSIYLPIGLIPPNTINIPLVSVKKL